MASKLQQYATDDGNAAIQIGTGENGLVIRARTISSKWGTWNKNIDRAMAKLPVQHREELKGKLFSDPDYAWHEGLEE